MNAETLQRGGSRVASPLPVPGGLPEKTQYWKLENRGPLVVTAVRLGLDVGFWVS